MKLVTSNDKKIKEFQRFGLTELEALPGPDIREVQGTADEVILYKTLEAARAMKATDLAVEDTILAIIHDDGSLEEIVDIRWRIQELASLPHVRIRWRTALGHAKDETIAIYIGETDCRIVVPVGDIPEDAFGFDPYLIPEGYEQTVYELEKAGKKDEISPRRKAVEALLQHQPAFEYQLSEIPEWTGEYQHTETTKSEIHMEHKIASRVFR